MKQDAVTLEIHIRSDPSELAGVRQQIEPFVRDAGLSEDQAGRVVLAVDEALANVIRHAYDNQPDRPIEIRLTRRDALLELRVRDFGRAVDPATICPRDLDDVRPGGLGVHIMREVMDELRYQSAPGGGTELTMTKRITTNPKDRT